MEHNIQHQQKDNKGSAYLEIDNVKRAEMTYSIANNELMIIDHTEVDESLKGQGIGKKMQAVLVNYARENNLKIMPLCPFAKATFERTSEWSDVLSSR